MILPAFTIDEFLLDDGQLYEVGITVPTPAFTANYSQAAPYDHVYLTDTAGTPLKNVVSTPNGFFSNATFTNTGYTWMTFYLAAMKDGFGASLTTVLYWVQKAYWFVGVSVGSYDQAWVEASSAGTLVTSKNRTFTVTSGAGQYIYYVYRNGYGPSSFWVGGFEGGFSLVDTISMTRNGVTESYRVYRSTNSGLGVTAVTVTD
jgi:hypothetical protein